MKIILAVSLILNAILAVMVVRRPASTEPAAAPSGTSTVQSELPSLKKSLARGQTGTTNNAAPRKFNWESVESPDYQEYIANLRSIGCPEDTIRDIILADVNKLYDQKKKLARGEPKKFEYWKGGNPFMAGMASNPELLQKLKALDDERNNVLRTLGIEPDYKMQVAGLMNPLDSMMDFLSDSKKAEVMKVMTDMQSKMASSGKDGQPDPESMGKVIKEMNQAIAKILSPEEFQDYQLRFSMTANMLRSQVAGFEPSEEEFLKIFKLREAFDEEFTPFGRGNESETERKKRETEEKVLKEQIKSALGPERFADYERAQDWTFQQIYRSARQADLGTAEATQVYEMKKATEEQANKIRADRQMTPEKRREALVAIKQETEKSIQGVLGEKGWDHFNRGNNSYWLKNLVPPEAAKPTSPLQ